MTSKNNKVPLLYYTKLCASFQNHWWIQTKVTVRKCSMLVKGGDFFVPRGLEIWWMTLKNNRAPLLYYIKLCAAFQSYWHIQTRVTVQKRSIRVKNWQFFCPSDFENWRMTLKNNRTHLYTTSSCVHHFKSIGKVKLGLQPGNAQVW